MRDGVCGGGNASGSGESRRVASRRRAVTAAAAAAGALACGAFSLLWALQSPINDDDVYHLHSIWLVSQGAVPFRDFFECHLPGMWLLLSPAISWFHSASAVLIAARVATAVCAALISWLAACIVQARGLQVVLLLVAALGTFSHCQVWMFRVEYLAALLLVLHLALLAAWSDLPPRPWLALLAAVPLGLGCTMTVRVIPFLAVEPVAILWLARPWWRRLGGAWLAGLLLGTLPTLRFLARQHLWAEAFQWSFGFVASPEVVSWRVAVGHGEFAVLGLGAMAVWVSRRVGTLSWGRWVVLSTAWGIALLFQLANPHKIDFAALYLLLTTMLILAAAVPAISNQQPALVRDTALVIGAVGAIFFGRLVTLPPWPPDRRAQVTQLEVVDWLQAVGGEEPVVLVAPYHPIVVRDATDIQNASQYALWLTVPAVAERVRDFAERVRRVPPPVLAADPWPDRAGGRELPEWLHATRVLDDAQRRALRGQLATGYVRIAFEALSSAYGLPFGSQFWVRRDRLAAHPPPPSGRVIGEAIRER